MLARAMAAALVLAAGVAAAEDLKLNKGDRAMVWGLLSQPTRGLRTKGVVDALKESGLEVDYLEIDAATIIGLARLGRMCRTRMRMRVEPMTAAAVT